LIAQPIVQLFRHGLLDVLRLKRSARLASKVGLEGLQGFVFEKTNGFAEGKHVPSFQRDVGVERF
jgi:hypothetical protein